MNPKFDHFGVVSNYELLRITRIVFLIYNISQLNISVPDDEWFEEWTSDDFVALPERVDVAYENEHYNPKLQYLTGVARDDASYMICKFYNKKGISDLIVFELKSCLHFSLTIVF